MSEYHAKTERELQRWEYKIYRPASMPLRVSKRWQRKMNNKIPEKIHSVFSESVRQMVKTALWSSDYISDKKVIGNKTLRERDELLDRSVRKYKRIAAAEGAGTGFGGIMLGLTDFPLLLNIKMAFLFEAAHIYGFSTDDIEERLFLLHVFQLAFSKEDKKIEAFQKVANWEKNQLIPGEAAYIDRLDWKTFQLEYRDYIDLPKTLQLIPGFGAIVGAAANYHYLDNLAYHTRNSYRWRIINKSGEVTSG